MGFGLDVLMTSKISTNWSYIVNNIFKKSALMGLMIFSSSFLSNIAHADFVSNDSKNLAQCRSLVKAEVGQVDSMKVGNIKSKARSFTANFKVVNNGERSSVKCRLAKGQTASVSCLKGNACDGVAISGVKTK